MAIGPSLRIFKINQSGRERRRKGKERKGKGAGVGEEKRSERRGVAWGLSQSSNIVGKTPKFVDYTRQDNAEMENRRHEARRDQLYRHSGHNPQSCI